MFSTVSASIASEDVKLPAFTGADKTTESIEYYNIKLVGEGSAVGDGVIDVTTQVTEVAVKKYPDAVFVISLDSNGDIAIGYETSGIFTPGTTKPTNYEFIYGDATHDQPAGN